jgi:hypothetical protein
MHLPMVVEAVDGVTVVDDTAQMTKQVVLTKFI